MAQPTTTARRNTGDVRMTEPSSAPLASPQVPIPSASLWENIVYNALYVIPAGLQGTFTRNAFWTRVASAVSSDPGAVHFFTRLRAKYRSGAIFVKLLTTPSLVVMDRD